jgi:opacity protein-like surface antigen
MRNKFLLFMATLCLLASAASAQNYRADFRQEISTQGTGNFTSSTNDVLSSITSSTATQATRSGGFLIGYRYHMARWFAIEGDYAFTRQTQNFLDPINLPNGLLTSALKTNIHEITAAAVITGGPRHRVRPYGLLGGGAILFRPVNQQVSTVLNIVNTLGFGPSETKPAFLYGAGLDISLNRFLALRAVYRGLVFSAPGFQIPGLSVLGLSTPGLTHMAQPSAGLVWRF